MSICNEEELRKFPEQPLGFSGKKFSRNLVSWYQKNHRSLPWRERWKKHGDPWHVWVSEIMLQQTVIKAVIPVYERFLERYPDPESLLNAAEEDIAKTVRGLGYYRRFRLLQKGCGDVVAAGFVKKRGKKTLNFPRSFHDWKQISGVGDYTAAAVSSICFNEPKGVVDGNVERVLCRIFDIRLPPNIPLIKKSFQNIVDRLVDKEFPGDFNQGLMETGQLVCTSQDPACHLCPLRQFCRARKAGSTELSPAPKIKQSSIEVRMRLTIVVSGQRIAVRKRPGDAKFLKSTGGFLTELLEKGTFKTDGDFGNANPAKRCRIGAVRHNITRHKISAEVCYSRIKDPDSLPEAEWYSADDIEENLVSNLDRKAWNLFQKHQLTTLIS